MMLLMKFDYDQQLISEIFVFESEEQTDRRPLESHPISSLCAFGSGELIKEMNKIQVGSRGECVYILHVIIED